MHASTEEKDEVTRDDFYGCLEILYDSVPHNDVKMLFGYSNAQIGNDDRSTQLTRGQ